MKYICALFCLMLLVVAQEGLCEDCVLELFKGQNVELKNIPVLKGMEQYGKKQDLAMSSVFEMSTVCFSYEDSISDSYMFIPKEAVNFYKSIIVQGKNGRDLPFLAFLIGNNVEIIYKTIGQGTDVWTCSKHNKKLPTDLLKSTNKGALELIGAAIAEWKKENKNQQKGESEKSE